jgi:glyoxylase-like metal-dependent hydrolase (beta-lactamase superfamily II)/acetolactate synthase regulatory subunit
MSKFSFVARMPDEPGMMHRAAEIVKRHQGNIERVHYDRRIDAHTVFFEVLCDQEAYRRINDELKAIGFLQTSLEPLSFLKYHVYLPNRSGALFELLQHTTSAGANIAYMDFDDREHPERLTVSMTLDRSAAVDALLNQLKSLYRLEIMEYDTTGKKLDDTVFYLRFAQQLREIIGDTEDEFLFQLMRDINHIVQALTNLGEDYHEVFDSILLTGRTLKATCGSGFYADIQSLDVGEGSLVCAQLPCGGSVYLLRRGGEMVMFDAGFGIYHEDLKALLLDNGFGDLDEVRRLFVTHADADHAGAGGLLDAVAHMHPGTLEILGKSNRAYGSKVEGSILEEVYTRLINLFSEFTPPTTAELFLASSEEKEGPFDVIGRFRVADLEFKAVKGLDGHLHGQTYFLCEEEGLLFTGDTLLNFASFTPERQRFADLANVLMTSVNVDSEAAARERKGLMEIADRLDQGMRRKGKRCLVCGGHGAVSVVEEGKLRAYGQALRLSRRA